MPLSLLLLLWFSATPWALTGHTVSGARTIIAHTTFQSASGSEFVTNVMSNTYATCILTLGLLSVPLGLMRWGGLVEDNNVGVVSNFAHGVSDNLCPNSAMPKFILTPDSLHITCCALQVSLPSKHLQLKGQVRSTKLCLFDFATTPRGCLAPQAMLDLIIFGSMLLETNGTVLAPHWHTAWTTHIFAMLHPSIYRDAVGDLLLQYMIMLNGANWTCF